jgi:ABC-type polysaccharide/polyol phosphate export permease
MIKHIRIGIYELASAARTSHISLYFAIGDVRARYRRSAIGPFWMVLSTLISVAGLGMVWSNLLHQDPGTLVPSLTVGLVVWQFMSGVILESSSILLRYGQIIKNLPFQNFVRFSLALLFRQLIVFLHNAVVILVVFLIYPQNVSWVTLLVVPGFMLVFISLFLIASTLAIVGARFRDVEMIIGSVMPLLFLLSPVLYRSSQLGDLKEYAWINPFSYFISLIRDPLFGEAPPLFVYVSVSLAMMFGLILTSYIVGRYKYRVPIWL